MSCVRQDAPRPEHVCEKHEPSAACYTRHRCRCDGCCAARSRYMKRRKFAQSQGRTYRIDAAPVRAHLQRCIDAGLTVTDISERSQYGRSEIRDILDGKQTGITRSAAERIAVVQPTRTPRRAYIDPTGTRRRVHALIAVGWTYADIADQCGRRRQWVSEFMQSSRVHAKVAAAIADAFDHMWQGPDVPCPKSLHAARLNGYLTALAWDDDHGPHGIDNPDATPYTDRRKGKRETSAEKVEWLLDGGLRLEGIIDRLDTNRSSLNRALDRAGRGDLWERLTREEAA